MRGRLSHFKGRSTKYSCVSFLVSVIEGLCCYSIATTPSLAARHIALSGTTFLGGVVSRRARFDLFSDLDLNFVLNPGNSTIADGHRRREASFGDLDVD